jgi:sugar phosphate isomerase/epimerase
MKLGLITNCYRDMTWEEAAEAARKAGLKAVEPVAGGYFGKKHCNPEFLLKDRDALKRFVDVYESRELVVSGLSVHGNPLHPDGKIASAHKRDIVDAIKLAEIIGVRVVIGFAGCPGAGEGAKYPNWITCPWPSYFAEGIEWQWKKVAIPFWSEIAGVLGDSGVVFAFEMAPGDLIYNPETLTMLRDAVGTEVCCNFDPSHLFFQGIDVMTAVKRLGEMIVHVHAKDSKIDEDVARWRGTIDWKSYGEVIKRAWVYRTCGYGHDRLWWNDFVSSLRLVGYDGVISIEHEDTLMTVGEGLQKAITFLTEVLMHEGMGMRWWEVK